MEQCAVKCVLSAGDIGDSAFCNQLVEDTVKVCMHTGEYTVHMYGMVCCLALPYISVPAPCKPADGINSYQFAS